MGKLEKLREIKSMISDVLIDLETYIFLNDINIDEQIKINENENNIVISQKQ